MIVVLAVRCRLSNRFQFAIVLGHFLLLWPLVNQATSQSHDALSSAQTLFNPDVFSPLSRLRDPKIRRMLELTADQIKQIDTIQDGWLAGLGAHGELSQADRNRSKLRELMHDFEEKATAVLSHEQREQFGRLFVVTRFSTFVPTLAMLRNDHVQTDLGLRSAQRQAIEGLYEKWLQDGEAFLLQPENRDVVNATIRTQARRLMPFGRAWEVNARASLVNALTKAQIVRLDQIKLQIESISKGPSVLLLPENSEELQLSPQQIGKIRQLAEEYSHVTRDRGRKRVERKREIFYSCLDLFNEDQSSLWKRKVGEPYYSAGDISSRSKAQFTENKETN